MLTPSEADALIQQHLTCLPIESLPLAQCTGTVLRENIYAERDQPPFDRVMMDGIAIDSGAVRAGRRSFRVQGIQAAGEPQQRLLQSDGCLEVMTGAVLPEGCDCVIAIEHIELLDGHAHLTPDPRPAPLSRSAGVGQGGGAKQSGTGIKQWQNVHRRASDNKQGDRLLEAGSLLQAPEVAVAASAGMSRIRVSGQPAVMAVSTGNELVEPDEPIENYQIRRSNVYGIAAALRQRGFSRVGDDHLPDDRDALRERLRLHFTTHDVLILSGGVSRGRYDFVPQALEELGVRTVFHGIAQRPGKPMWFGVAAAADKECGPAVFALPGNPVSTLVCLVRYVLPAFYQAMGLLAPRIEKIALAKEVEFQAPLTKFLPVRIECDEWGRHWAVPQPTHNSGDFTSLAGTDGFVELPPGPNVWPKGFVTRLYRW